MKQLLLTKFFTGTCTLSKTYSSKENKLSTTEFRLLKKLKQQVTDTQLTFEIRCMLFVSKFDRLLSNLL